MPNVANIEGGGGVGEGVGEGLRTVLLIHQNSQVAP